MILQCPSCDARFLVPDTAINTTGRRVRCGKCAYQWHAKLPKAAQADLPDVDALFAQPAAETPRRMKPKSTEDNRLYDRSTHAPATRRDPFPLWMPALAVLLLLIAAGLGVMNFAPSLAGFPPSEGLKLDSLVLKHQPKPAEQRFEATYEHYALEGNIFNSNKEGIKMPTVRITLINVEGKPVESWLVAGSGEMIAPNQSIQFHAESLAKPKDEPGYFMVELGNTLEFALKGSPKFEP